MEIIFLIIKYVPDDTVSDLQTIRNRVEHTTANIFLFVCLGNLGCNLLLASL